MARAGAEVWHAGKIGAEGKFLKERLLATISPKDLLLLQNEISALTDVMALAAARGMRAVFNPAPFGPEVSDYPLQNVDLFILNETEGQGLTGTRCQHS